MTPDDFDAKLTAYALNDASLTDAERTEIEARLRDDPAARQELEQTRQLGHLLSKSLAAEAEAAAPSVAPAVAASLAGKPAFRRWAITIASLAAVVMLAAFAGQNYFSQKAEPRVSRESRPLDEAELPEWARQNERLDPGAGPFEYEPIDRPSRKEFSQKSPAEPFKTESSPANPVKLDAPVGKDVPLDPTQADRLFGSGGPGAGGFQGGIGKSSGGSGFGGGFMGGGGGFPGVGGPPAPPVVTRPHGTLPPSDPKGAITGDRVLTPRGRAQDDDETSIVEVKKAPKDEEPGRARSRLSARGIGESRLGGDQYRQLIENPFTRVEGMDALSTFGVDVDTASYSIVRNHLNHNTIPHPDAVRLEEMINYFPYQDAPPDGNDPFTVRVEMADCPWASKHRLARIALKAKPIDNGKRPPSNLVFLIDVSGSMDEPNKLPLVKAAMKLLVEQLTENDRVAIVVYAGASGIVLDSTNATKKDTILQAIDNLSAGGSTNGGSGIHLAYETAVKNFREKGTNRVILCTDGDWNVGTTGTEELVKLIEEKKKTGVFLSVFGFGMGNLRDEMMVQLAGKGNGNYGYIDTLREAKKALVEQISGTLVTVAKDVKIQIEFNPAKISSYRLIGYEKRKLAAEDFHNDKKDAGEMGAGHVVTALYELIPVGAAAAEAPKVDGLRYQPAVEAPKAATDAKTSNEAFVIKLRHKAPDADKSTLREIPVGDVAKSYDKASEDFQFASAVAAFGMLLKQSPYKGQASYALVEELAASSMKHDPSGYRAEFVQLVKKAKSITGQK